MNPSLRTIIDDVFLCNYQDKSKEDTTLVNIEELGRLVQNVKNIEINNMACAVDIGYNTPTEIKYLPLKQISGHIHKFENVAIHDAILNKCTFIHKLLSLGCGEFSLCGGAVINILDSLVHRRDYVSSIRDYDIFFHCNIDKADLILQKCLNFIDEYSKSIGVPVRYIRSMLCLTVITGIYTIQFIKHIYPSRSKILLDFDLTGCRYGWNPVDGFFTTTCGAWAFALGAFPIDISMRRLNCYGPRLHKYINKNFAILLPNVLDNEDSVITPDGIFTRIHGNIFRFVPESYDSHKTWSYDGSELNNWSVINQLKEHIVFSSENKDDILTLPDHVVKKSLMNFPPEITRGLYNSDISSKKLRESGSIDHITLSMFFADEKKYIKFATAYYIERDLEKSIYFIDQKINEYISEGLKWAQYMNLKDKQWTVGKNFIYPGTSIISSKDWYKDSRKPIEVGISHKRLQAFIECYKNIGCFNLIPIELFKMLCSYWLEAEMAEARIRLSVFLK